MLRHLTFLAVTAVVLTSVACAPEESRETRAADAPPVVATAGEDVEATIIELEREWVAAIVNKDQAALGRLLADDFAGTSPTAHVYTKDMAIADLSKGTYVVDAMDMTRFRSTSTATPPWRSRARTRRATTATRISAGITTTRTCG